MRNSYDTKQKELLLNTIKGFNKQFEVKEIYESLKGEVGLTTIYRFLEKLEKEKLVTKIVGSDNRTYFEYLERCEEENHFYLKCDKCGSLTHVDCDCINELSTHISKEHSFNLNKENIIMKGICKNCK